MTEIISLNVYYFLMVFLRLGSAIMLMPGFMTSYVNMRVRLIIALVISVVLIPIISPSLPPHPESTITTIEYILFEITIGVFLGAVMQLLYSALSLGGNLAGQAIGFANAQMFDPTFHTQTIIIESFLGLIAITIIFMTDLHHLMLSSVVDSYHIFPVGVALPVSDMSETLSQTLNDSFIMGFKIGSPFIAFTIIFYVGMGLVSRLMPQLNIFFLSLPLQIYLGLGLLFLTIPIMILWFLRYYEQGIEQFLH